VEKKKKNHQIIAAAREGLSIVDWVERERERETVVGRQGKGSSHGGGERFIACALSSPLCPLLPLSVVCSQVGSVLGEGQLEAWSGTVAHRVEGASGPSLAVAGCHPLPRSEPTTLRP